MMKFNKLNIGLSEILVIIGSIASVLSVILSVFLPQMMSVWKTDADMELTTDGGIYLNWFGFFTGTIGISDIAFYVLTGGVLIILGSVISIIGVLMRSKRIKIIAGLLIIAAPIFVIIDLLVGSPDYIHSFPILHGRELSNFFGTAQANALGEDIFFTWGISTGFFMILTGGVSGLLGGLLHDYKPHKRKQNEIN